LDEELGDQRSGERGRERIGALVQRVGLEVGPDEVADEPVPRVDDVGARGSGADRATLDPVAQRPAADVDRQADDLAVVLLAQPGDGDGRIEPAGVGEDDLLHDVRASVAAERMESNRSRHASRRASSAKRTRSVLSPASVPSCSVSDDSSIAWAMTLAGPGE